MKAGDVVTSPSGKRWRVKCVGPTGTLGLEPVGMWHRLKWWLRGCL